MMRDPEVRSQLILHCLLTILAVIPVFTLSIPSALILLGFSLAVLCVSLYQHWKRSRKISQLCDSIDDILHGKEQVELSSFEEGELNILITEIQKMTIRLREQNAVLHQNHIYLKESMEDISHQLRTPLTSMHLLLGMLRSPELSHKERMEYLQELYGLAARMQWLIETLLNLSRLEAGAVHFRQETVHCRTLIRAALEPVAVAIELKGITVDVQINGSPEFTGDLQYCTEAVCNLLKNCMEHTPENGRITITAQENPIYTQLCITDTGSGIRQEDLPHIFERFYRSSDFAKSGYGIGLAFARKVIAKQNGSLQVRNAKTGGAEFDLRIYKTVV